MIILFANILNHRQSVAYIATKEVRHGRVNGNSADYAAWNLVGSLGAGNGARNKEILQKQAQVATLQGRFFKRKSAFYFLQNS